MSILFAAVAIAVTYAVLWAARRTFGKLYPKPKED